MNKIVEIKLSKESHLKEKNSKLINDIDNKTNKGLERLKGTYL